MMDVVKKTPALRFPQFSGEWDGKQFGQINDKNIKWSFTGGPFGSDLKAEDYTDHGIRIIQLQNIGDGVFNDGNKIYTSEQKADSLLSCNIYPNEIIISKMGDPVARACLMPDSSERYLMSSDGIRFVPQKSLYDNYFIFLYVNLPLFRKQAIACSTGSTRKRIGLSELRKLNLSIPNIEEQQKIASFLSQVDDKIEQLTKKKQLLADYKKGVMQQVFSQEIRFKQDDGSDYPDWEVKKLGELAKFFSGGTPTSTNREYYMGDIPFIGSGKINDDSIKQFITEEALSDSSAKLVNKGDLLYALYGATSGEVAISKIDGAINQAVLCIRSDESISFLHQFLLLKKERILTTFLQGGQGNLSAQIVKNIKLNLPDVAEQTKIANFLTEIDTKIDQIEKQLEGTKKFKSGLLQQMFV